MDGESFLQKAYLFVGGFFSVFYLVVGLFICTGRLNFGMAAGLNFLFGAAIICYGIFRGYVFYKKYKVSRETKDES